MFLDSFNREGKIAQKATEGYGVNFKFYTRKPSHYLDIWPFSGMLLGRGFDSFHLHNYSLHKLCDLMQYPAVFGGYYSDALLKGSRIRKHNINALIPFFPQIKKRNFSQTNALTPDVLSKKNNEELWHRHLSHYNRIAAIRPESGNEWFELWPASMNLTMSYYNGNRRLFRSFEPFLAHDIVKIAAAVPQQWKLNRRLYHAMAKPLLRTTKHLLHGEGWMPYYPWYANFFIHGLTLVTRRIESMLGHNKGHQGPWGDWQRLFDSQGWKIFQNKICPIGDDLFGVFQESVGQLIAGKKTDADSKATSIAGPCLEGTIQDYSLKAVIIEGDIDSPGQARGPKSLRLLRSRPHLC